MPPRLLSETLPKIFKEALGKKKANLLLILKHWPSIVGPELALKVFPEKISFNKDQADGAVLYVKTYGSAAIILQHEEPLIIQRINAVFGYKAVKSLRISQTYTPKTAAKTVIPTQFPPEKTAQISEMTSAIQDSSLRQALEHFAISLHNRRAHK